MRIHYRKDVFGTTCPRGEQTAHIHPQIGGRSASTDSVRPPRANRSDIFSSLKTAGETRTSPELIIFWSPLGRIVLSQRWVGRKHKHTPSDAWWDETSSLPEMSRVCVCVFIYIAYFYYSTECTVFVCEVVICKTRAKSWELCTRSKYLYCRSAIAGCSDLDVTQRDKHMGQCTEFKQAIWQQADNAAALWGRSAALSCRYFCVIWPAWTVLGLTSAAMRTASLHRSSLPIFF